MIAGDQRHLVIVQNVNLVLERMQRAKGDFLVFQPHACRRFLEAVLGEISGNGWKACLNRCRQHVQQGFDV